MHLNHSRRTSYHSVLRSRILIIHIDREIEREVCGIGIATGVIVDMRGEVRIRCRERERGRCSSERFAIGTGPEVRALPVVDQGDEVGSIDEAIE